MLLEPLLHQVEDRETCSLSALDSCEDSLHNAIDYLSDAIIPTASLTIHQNPMSDLISGHKSPLPLVQDQLTHSDEELEPLEEFNLPENVEKLTSLCSQLAERTTLVQKGLFDLDLPLFLTTVDCIFDPLPSSLVQLPTPISAAPSILLTPPSLFDRITKLQG
jgi:hypothetical protein